MVAKKAYPDPEDVNNPLKVLKSFYKIIDMSYGKKADVQMEIHPCDLVHLYKMQAVSASD